MQKSNTEELKKSKVKSAKKVNQKDSKTSTKKISAKSSKNEKTSKTRSSTLKASSSKSTSKEKAKTSRVVTKQAKSKKVSKSSKLISDFNDAKFENIVEYYDLPYGYNKTVVKVLYQNPTTLFVYWEISDDDVSHFKNEFGDNFFYITKPVLIVHNVTKDYSFKIDINDFANNWYINVDDAKCKYEVKLARIPSQSTVIYDYDNNHNTDFVEISNSNVVEMPNDHVLFYKNNQKIYFKNIKDNSVVEKVCNFNSVDYKNLKSLYKNYSLSEIDNRFDFKNPSSQNPTSNVM